MRFKADLCVGLRKIYTGGKDSLVRVWKTSIGADQEPDMVEVGDDQEAVTSIATSVCAFTLSASTKG